MNIGLQEAQGKYIARMDADDLSHPDRLRRQMIFMEQHPEIGASGTWLRKFGRDDAKVTYPLDDATIRSELFFSVPLAHATIILRHQVIQAHHILYREVLHGEDHDLWLQLAPLTFFANLPEFLYDYRQYDTQTTFAFVNEMVETGREVRRQQLIDLGIVPSEEDLNLHMKILNSHATKDKSFQISAETWLNGLLFLNQQNHKYPSLEFSQAISRRWWMLCEQSSPLYIPNYLSSPLSRMAKLSSGIKAKIIAKSLLRPLKTMAVIILQYGKRKTRQHK